MMVLIRWFSLDVILGLASLRWMLFILMIFISWPWLARVAIDGNITTMYDFITHKKAICYHINNYIIAYYGGHIMAIHQLNLTIFSNILPYYRILRPYTAMSSHTVTYLSHIWLYAIYELLVIEKTHYYNPTTRVPQGMAWCRGGNRNGLGGGDSLDWKYRLHSNV